MRVINALKADIKFQFKQGFYLVYIVLTIVYMIVIGQLPENIANFAVPLVIFSDPSIVGFFFIGGIVMLERIQGVIDYLVVTPLKTVEYLLAKIISLALLAEFAGFIIANVIYNGEYNWVLLFIGIFLTSSFFTLYGFIVVAGCYSINQYFVKMVPYMLFIIIPCLFLIRWPNFWVLDLFPGVAGIKLVYGAFYGIVIWRAIIYISLLLIYNILIFIFVEDFFERKIIYKEGV